MVDNLIDCHQSNGFGVENNHNIRLDYTRTMRSPQNPVEFGGLIVSRVSSVLLDWTGAIFSCKLNVQSTS